MSELTMNWSLWTWRRVLPGLCMAGVVVAVCGCKGDDPKPDSKATVARAAVAMVERGPVEKTLSVAGEFVPFQEVELHAKVAGYIRRINVDIGDKVRTGQVLATLEVPELNAQVTGAEAGVRHSQEEISLAKSEVLRAEANHQALHMAADRLRQASAARPGMIAQQELDDAEAKDRAAEAQVAVAKSTVAAQEQQMAVATAEHLHYSSLADYSRITAPFDGVVTWRYADTGALIQAGTSNAGSMPVVKVAQVNVLRLRIPVPESLAGYVRDGDVAEVRVQATGNHFSGKVVRTTGALDRATRSLQVEVDVANAKGALTPGMYADVTLRIAGSPDALTIPVQALDRETNGASVLVVKRDRTVERRAVRTGLETPEVVQVVDGLHEGERVIVGNLASFEPGQYVDARPSAMAQASAGKEQ
ncbi:efflux RND transporter periplasmic adaptor subunit [Edaphobacter aggregans]|uniref:efflux RND transporter periplasmic adaptor subunit n=1 Tax=Edaphobacter aggregans TaxID=570835 RepID=UPI0012FB4440|nr:efflux RND transporter periplasmic adaptor subunit [Edaphobacter aggregans]